MVFETINNGFNPKQIMKKLLICLVLVALILASGCVQELNKEYCEKDSDCIATCAYGCVNAEWMEGKVDCKALPLFECECVEGQCSKKPSEKKVTIATNKTEYEAGETVHFTVSNNSDKNAFFGSFPRIEKLNGKWRAVSKPNDIRCPCGALCEPIPSHFPIPPNEQTKFSWDQKIQKDCNRRTGKETIIPAASGTYRMTGTYKFSKSEVGKEIHSNEFTIKKKPSTGEVTVHTDKTEYKQGESVKIAVKNGLNKPIWYYGDLCEPNCCGIKRLENGEWKTIEKIYCIMLEQSQEEPPSSSDIYRTPSKKLEGGEKLTQEWNAMKRAKYDAVTFIGAGEYRVVFSYGLSENSYNENTIHSNSFTIKKKEYPSHGKIINVNLMIDKNDRVSENTAIKIETGKSTPRSILKQMDGNYLLRVGEKVDRLNIGTVLWSQSFPVNFDYAGPVIEGIDYSELEYGRVNVSFRIPYEPEMKSLQLWRMDKGKLVFFRELPKFYPIRGTVMDYNDNPIEMADVELYKEGTFLENTFTNEKGEYSFAEIEAGKYKIIIRPQGKANSLIGSKDRITVKDDEITDINFVLEPCGSIGGKITDINGNPLTEAWVQVAGFETPRHHVCENAEECELGTYIIPYLEPEEYEVKADVKIGEEYIEIPSKTAKVELGETTELNFVFEK